MSYGAETRPEYFAVRDVASVGPQQIGLLVASFLNALLSVACCTGLLLAIGITVANNGKGLMFGCNETMVPINARSPVSAQCPFDTTRIYVSLEVLFFLKRQYFASTFYCCVCCGI